MDGQRGDDRRSRTMRERSARLPSHLVGRRTEIAAVERALDAHRVVTIVGPPGAGATALAVAVAERTAAGGRFPDGRWLCDLTACTETDAVAAAIAAELGLTAGDGAPVDRVVESVLRARDGLLVLDQADHVASGCFRVLGRLVDRCPRLRVVVTSLDPLRFPGEQVIELGPLDDEGPGPGDAAALFVERAVAADPGFDAPVHTTEVAEVVGLLDGLPLAVELVAARAGERRFADVATSVVDALGGHRRASNGEERRHPSIVGPIVDWTLGLRPTNAPLLLERLSVFVAGFDDDGARAVMDGITRDRQVPWLIAELVDARLAEPWGSSRYRVPEPVRRHADTRLGARGERAAVRDLHLRHHVGVVGRASNRCAEGDWAGAHAVFDAVGDDIGAAVTWATDCRRGGDVDRLLGDLVLVGRWSGSPAPARWARRALERAGATGMELGAPAHLHEAAARSLEGDHRSALRAALAAIDDAATPSERAWAHHDAAFALLHLGRTAEAAAQADRMVAVPPSLPVEDALRRSAHAIFKLHARQIDLADAVAEIDRAAHTTRDLGHPVAVAQVTFDRAVAALAGDEPGAAVAALGVALDLAGRHGAAGITTRVLAALAAVPGTAGLGLVLAVLEGWTERPDPGNEWVVLDAAALGLAAAGRPEPAAILLGHLEPDRRRPATGATRRDAVTAEIDGHRRGESWRARGRQLDRSSAIAVATAAVRSALAPR